MRSYCIRVGPNLMTGVLIRRGKFRYRHKGIQGEGHVKTEACVSAGLAGVAGNQPKLGRAKGRPSSRAFRENVALLTPCFWTSSLHNYKRINGCCFEPPKFVTSMLQQSEEAVPITL